MEGTEGCEEEQSPVCNVMAALCPHDDAAVSRVFGIWGEHTEKGTTGLALYL